MRSAATAIAWEFRQRHRWGLIGVICYVFILATIKLVVVASGQPIKLDSPQSFAFVIVVPVSATMMYFVAVFSFGLSGDFGARQSIYPARMFTLPVSSAALACWPMLYGTAAVALLWIATRLFALWPSAFEVPVIWPGLLAAALVGWSQATTWLPYGLRGLRVIVVMLPLIAVDTVVLLALHYDAAESTMIAILAPQVPLAYLVAWFAVARARRGDVPDWRGMFSWFAQPAILRSRRRADFRSAAGAQAWFEWRRTGRSLAVWTAILLPLELALLALAGNVTVLVFVILLGVLVTPPIMATFSAASVSKSNSNAIDAHGFSPFLATRPLTSAALVAAKLKATIWSTGAAWLLALAAIPLALKFTGTSRAVIVQISHVVEDVGMPRAIVLLLLLFSGLILWTWKQLVQSLYIGLTGREWLIKGSVFFVLSLLFLIGPITQWIIEHKEAERALWDAVPGILALLVCVKLAAAAWVATRLYRSRLLSDRAIITGAACWCAVVFALYGVLAWFVATPFFPRYVLALLAILAIPLARLSAAPLALAWNRHR